MRIDTVKKEPRPPGRSWRYHRDCPSGRIFEVGEIAAAEANGWQDHPWFDEPAEDEKRKRGPGRPRRKDE